MCVFTCVRVHACVCVCMCFTLHIVMYWRAQINKLMKLNKCYMWHNYTYISSFPKYFSCLFNVYTFAMNVWCTKKAMKNMHIYNTGNVCVKVTTNLLFGHFFRGDSINDSWGLCWLFPLFALLSALLLFRRLQSTHTHKQACLLHTASQLIINCMTLIYSVYIHFISHCAITGKYRVLNTTERQNKHVSVPTYWQIECTRPVTCCHCSIPTDLLEHYLPHSTHTHWPQH